MADRCLDPSLLTQLANRFSEQAMAKGGFPAARAPDLQESCEISASEDSSELRLTCTITGSTYETPWDGSENVALSFVSEAAEDTAELIAGSRYYAWMQSSR